MPAGADFQAIFERLKPVIQRYEARLVVTENGPQGYSLNTPYSAKFKKELFFAAVQVNKSYVSFHLMPVYIYPDLLDGISPALRKRMQGKSCFNFSAIDEPLFTELAALTERSVQRVRKEGLAPQPEPEKET